MNTFTLVQRALDASANDESKAGLGENQIETGRVLSAVQTVVDALTPGNGGRYVVAFADILTAQTALGDRKIIVSSKPLHDASLSLVEKAVVIATFAAHEIGHTFVTEPKRGLVTAHNPHTGFHAVANLADDIILEPFMIDRAPILEDAFTFTGLWVLRTTAKGSLPKREYLKRGMSTPERFNLILSATRYGDIDEIVWHPSAVRERIWARSWADRLISARLNDHDTFLSLCDEAWERIRSEADVPPEPEPEPEPDQPGTEPGESGSGEEDGPDDDEDEGESEPGEGEGDGEPQDGDGQPGGEPGDDGAGEGDEPGEGDGDEGEDGDGSGDGDGESESDGDGTGDGDGDDATESGEPEGGVGVGKPGDDMPDLNQIDRDWDDDTEAEGEGTDEEFGNASESTPDDAVGGGGDANADDATLRPEDDFDTDEVEESMHDSAERTPYDWNAQRDDEAARIYASTTRTAFGKHGSMSTTWE